MGVIVYGAVGEGVADGVGVGIGADVMVGVGVEVEGGVSAGSGHAEKTSIPAKSRLNTSAMRVLRSFINYSLH